MRKGGNVVDVVIVVNVIFGLMELIGNGIGGDLFVIVWDGEIEMLYGLNVSGRFLVVLMFEVFVDKGLICIFSYGFFLIIVFGCVDGWFELYVKFGKFLMEEVLVLVIWYVCDGFFVLELIVYYWCLGIGFVCYFGFVEIFLLNGCVLCKGEMFCNLVFVDIFEVLVSNGWDEFYKGFIVKWIDLFMCE